MSFAHSIHLGVLPACVPMAAGGLDFGGVRKVCACCGGEISSSRHALYKLFARTRGNRMEVVCTHYQCGRDRGGELAQDGFLPVDPH